ncbi:unnamed protein product [Diatraea saccharalis]|uniref:Uncharacterized protein n=1 Tax=Diatraea saccharalis TaxID=40085 RepID=A0A9N9QLD3_9NEOP|nr:unnamed protein product [Diatraea saccharalis]
MRAVWILIATAVATTVAVPVNEISLAEKIAIAGDHTRNSFLEELLLGLIEDLRHVLLNGNDDLPPLDPLVIEQLSLSDEDIPVPGAQIELSGVKVSNLASFVIDDLSVSLTSVLLQRFRIQIDGRIPFLDIDAVYDASLEDSSGKQLLSREDTPDNHPLAAVYLHNCFCLCLVKNDRYDINVSAMGINLFGAGDAKIKVINPALKIDMLVSLRVSISQGVSLVLLETEAKFNLEAFQPEITGIFNDDGASAFINDFLAHFVPSAAQAYENEINEFLSETIHDIVSDVFDNLDL